MLSTVAAIATPPGTGGIAIIRISGGDAVKVADALFKGKTPLDKVKPYYMQYGKIHNPKGELLDNGLCVVMRAPASFTGEDVVELHIHGGRLLSERVLEAALLAGAEMAPPGEFTKRAFLNGKLDLTQAEAVADIIGGKTELALNRAVNQLEGGLSDEINRIRDLVLDILSQIMVFADYPEEDIDTLKKQDFIRMLKDALNALSTLLNTAKGGIMLREGLLCVIAGRPNTGKSSLMNALLGEDRAIVTDIAGTTRDAVEQNINMGGIPVTLCDTAGIRRAEGEAEEIGVRKAMEYIENADICLMVYDSSDIGDEEIYETIKDKKHINVFNKNDLKRISSCGDAPWVSVSAKTGDGIDLLKKEIVRIAADGGVDFSAKSMITNLRQRDAAARAAEYIRAALNAINQDIPADLAAGDLESALSALGEIDGRTVSDEVVERIFERFCLGK